MAQEKRSDSFIEDCDERVDIENTSCNGESTRVFVRRIKQGLISHKGSLRMEKM
jgi:hypothetical protein